MSPDKRLVIDIGGGSTEVVIGEGFDPLLLESLSVGCVGLTTIFFDDGRISAKRLERARTAVRLELEPVQEAYRKLGWLQAFGSSGTVRVISDVLHRLNPDSPHITLDNLNALAERVIAAGHVDELDLPDVDAERAPVFPAGLAILLEVVESFGIDRVRVAEGAMREGLLYDLMGRFTNEDARVRSVRAMEKRYHIDASCRRTASRQPPSHCWNRSNRSGAWKIRWPSRCCAGPRGCTKPASTSPTPNITATAPTCSSTPTCRDFREKNNCCCRRWSAVIAANCRSSRSRICFRPGIGMRNF